MALYKTRSFFYIIGSDITQTKFRVLKVDRTEPIDLVLAEDKVEYTQSEIKDLITTINEGNKTPGCSLGGVARSASAFGILGFIRFWEGYYILLITKRRKVSVIGYHSIYKIEDTSMIYIPHESVRIPHDDEPKYVRLFNNIDLTSNFYFSYSYDLTNSLQHNLAPFKNFTLDDKDWIYEKFMKLSYDRDDEGDHISCLNCPPDEKHVHYVGYRNNQKTKYIWNSYLLEPMIGHIHPAWYMPVIHGFVAQSNICIYGRSFFLTLIARRSTHYAGTRFLKRGANFEGDVANEVETEQMLHDAHISSLLRGRFSSFVQIRGSIPCHWSQDVSKMVPKPPISIDVGDPYAVAAGRHFNQLLRRFGSPIFVLNLVKRREKKRHESILNEQYCKLIRQLNITLPLQHKIQHIAVDMARINKDKEENVMSHLAKIAYKAVKKTGIFFNKGLYYALHLNSNQQYKQLEKTFTPTNKELPSQRCSEQFDKCTYQTGIVRVNCVDCLDRTNTAQFSLGKCALAFQLYAFGVLEKPLIEFDSDCVRILEEMYEDHGDTLALQYGGSQLVHRIETYRKTAPWTSQGNDLMQSFSRYYSNTFSDQEKQNAINLFLGVFVPSTSPYPIWDLTSDYILHQSLARELWPTNRPSTTQWWDDEIMDSLPLPHDQVTKVPQVAALVRPFESKVDIFNEYHRQFEFCVLAESFHFNMPHSIRDYMPDFSTDINPFCVRSRHGKKSADVHIQSRMASYDTISDNLSNSASTSGPQPPSSASSSTSSSMESEASDDDSLSLSETDADSSTKKSILSSYNTHFPPFRNIYGNLVKKSSQNDLKRYKGFACVERFLLSESMSTSKDILISFEKVDRTEEIYSVFQGFAGASTSSLPPEHTSLLKYRNFASS